MLINSHRFHYIATDSDAAAYIAAVETADGGQILESSTRQAIDTYVKALKTGGIWTLAAQLLLLSGPRTLAGALVPLKGTSPTNGNGSAGATQFTSANYSRKSGLGDASNTSKYLNSGTAKSGLSPYSHALFAYGSIAATTGDKILLGSYAAANGFSILTLDEWAPGTVPTGRAFRSHTGAPGACPVSTSTSPATCMIGSRTAQAAASLYVDGTSTTNATNTTQFSTSLPLYIYSLNLDNSPITYSPAILQATGIFSTGLNATQAGALRSATATYVAAINTAF